MGMSGSSSRSVSVNGSPKSPYAGAPVLECVAKGVPGIFMDCHMMVSKPEQVKYPPNPHRSECINVPSLSG